MTLARAEGQRGRAEALEGCSAGCVGGDRITPCQAIAATVCREALTFARSTCSTGAPTCRCGTSRRCVRRYGVYACGTAVPFQRLGRPLPDHRHCVMTLPPGDHDFSNWIKAIKIRFVRTLEPSERRSSVRVEPSERGVWQRRFWEHAIRDEGDDARPMDYCPLQPGQARMIRDVGGPVALFDLSSLGGGWCLSAGVGRRRCIGFGGPVNVRE